MSGNRVEELEAKVRQLQATVDGLTDELMETKERLHVLEEEVEPDLDMDIIEGQPSRTPETQTNTNAQADGGTTQEPGTQEAVDEAVAGAADEAKAGESEEEDDADSADDIIVA